MIIYNKDKTQYIDFDIPDDISHIGVKCSGGADSTILLYMIIKHLMEYNKQNVILSVLTLAHSLNKYNNSIVSSKILHWILEHTKFKNFKTHHILYTEDPHSDSVEEQTKKIILNNQIDFVVSGNTANPLIYVKGLSDTALPERNIDQPRFNGPAIDKDRYPGSMFYQPFRQIDKRFIIDMYKIYDVLELFDISKSCTSSDGICGECWWCKEREWALNCK